MAESFVEMLDEPKNSLGRTEEAVAIVLADPSRIEELYQCYFQPDEWVRLRVSSCFKRIWQAEPALVEPYLDGFINDVSVIDQPSVQWTFAKLCEEMSEHLTAKQISDCKKIVRGYLEKSDDWIVLNNSIATLGTWAVDDVKLRKWLIPKLEALSSDDRNSVVKRAAKWADKLSRLS